MPADRPVVSLISMPKTSCAGVDSISVQRHVVFFNAVEYNNGFIFQWDVSDCGKFCILTSCRKKAFSFATRVLVVSAHFFSALLHSTVHMCVYGYNGSDAFFSSADQIGMSIGKLFFIIAMHPFVIVGLH